MVRALGRGGMGEVWLAQDERLAEPVALKFLPAEVRADPVALHELSCETARSHKLSHPNIVRIHDLHEEVDGQAFIAMEYVDGPTLSALRLEQPYYVLSWEALRPLVQQLCAALDYAHGEKVIHRDLKPGNIMIDSKGRLKLADFGIAATVSDSVSRVSGRYATSGTLPYMSPQQLAGKHPQVADDIYALGATLYELLSSKPPFFTGDITHQVLHEAPEPLGERLAALGIQNEIPPDVAAIVMACLAKDPARRPQSARAVAEWIGLEVIRKPSVESLAEAMFPQSETANAPSSMGASEPVASAPPVHGRRLALLVSGLSLALLFAGVAVWYVERPRNNSKASGPPALADKPRQGDESAADPALPEEGFASIFNGRDLTGWDGDPRFWSVQEGCVSGQSSEGNAPDKNTFLIWKGGVVDDFEMRLSYKLISGSSGVQYRSKDLGNWIVHGYKADISDAAVRNSGALANEAPERVFFGLLAKCGEKVAWEPEGRPQPVGWTDKPPEALQNAIDQGGWNDYVIIARGNHLVHWINGNLMMEMTDNDPKYLLLSGIIALQLHRNLGQPMKVQFRDIRLRRLGSPARNASLQEPVETKDSQNIPLLKPGQQWTNSLGMRFFAAPGFSVLFSTWDTRVRDFAAFVADTGHDATKGLWTKGSDGVKQRGDSWKNPGFAQTPTDPVGGVNWDDAKAFCQWLTKKEQHAGRLRPTQFYRPPTYAEERAAVELANELWAGPRKRDGQVKTVWCDDWFDSDQKFRVVCYGVSPGGRGRREPGVRAWDQGFCCVLEVGSSPP